MEQINSGGAWGVKIQPIGKDKPPVTHAVAGPDAAQSFIDGAMAMVELRKKGARTNGASDFDPSAVKRMPEAELLKMTRVQLRALNTHGSTTARPNATWR